MVVGLKEKNHNPPKNVLDTFVEGFYFEKINGWWVIITPQWAF